MSTTGKNISVFGPAHVGKSTLCGYMKTRLLSDVEFLKKENKIKEKAGKNYNSKYRFNYFIDKFDDLITSYKKNTGTTKSNNVKRVKWDENNQIIVIDTPGEQHRASSKGRGMYFGDIGVFVIEISKLFDDNGNLINKRSQFLSQLYLSKKQNDKIKLVIVFSKMDVAKINFSREIYLKAENFIYSLCEDKNIPIIPISVNIDDRDDHNIYKRSEKMSWYKGLTLKQVIDNLLVNSAIPTNEELFMITHTVYKKIPGIGTVWEGKILKGIMRKDNEIKICPVKVNGKYKNLTAGIKNIRYVDSNIDTEVAISGDIIGIDISSVKTDHNKIKKSSFNIIDTSCITLASTKVKYGNITMFAIVLDSTNINALIAEEIDQILIGDEISLLWFGRTVTGRVLEKKINNMKAYLSLEHEFRQVALPINNNYEFLFNKFLLRKKDEYFTGTITNIGMPNNVEMLFNNKNQISQIFGTGHKRFGYDFQEIDNSVIIKCENSYLDLLKQINQNKTIMDMQKENIISFKFNLEEVVF
jgi:translation elongation factor EF-1alpha